MHTKMHSSITIRERKKMHKYLDEISKLLNDFEMELSKIRDFWRMIEINNPDFEQVSKENW
jgi:hypothetical protein